MLYFLDIQILKTYACEVYFFPRRSIKCFEWQLFWTILLYRSHCPTLHPCQMPTTPRVMNMKLWLQVLQFLLADVFSHKTPSEEKISGEAVPWGVSPKWDCLIRKNTFVTLNCNMSWFLNDRNKILSLRCFVSYSFIFPF